MPGSDADEVAGVDGDHALFVGRDHQDRDGAFGGGDAWTGPTYPYVDSGTGDIIYGAPDGIPDGVILVLTDSTRGAGWVPQSSERH